MTEEILPSFEEYLNLSRSFSVVPVWKKTSVCEVDPIKVFSGLPVSGNCFILESVDKTGQSGKYSFIGFDIDEVIEFSENGPERSSSPMQTLRDYMEKNKAPGLEGLPPFYGGAVGYAGYGLVRFLEDVPQTGEDDLGMPVYAFMVAKNIIVFDHEKNCVKIVVNSSPGENPEKSYEAAREKIALIEKNLSVDSSPDEAVILGQESEISSNFNKEDFCRAVDKAKEYIESGEVFQVVLSQRLNTVLSSPAFLIYRVLRKINPSPYMFYLKLGDSCLIGSSPETHVKTIKNKVTIRPIAGTRKRGRDEQEDVFLEKDLLGDEKEKAEHLMLVDLARNDLGRVAETGSVVVDDFMKVFRYSHVMHIESNVTGILKKGKDRFDVFESSFPAGTVSGAPKIRAMEIIDELEPTARGPYAGAVGYFSYSGNMDTCITIRTIIIKGKEVYVQAGAGIVADSVPENEYNETLNKAKALIKALSQSSAIHRNGEDDGPFNR